MCVHIYLYLCVYNVCICVYIIIISWLKNFTRVGILVTIALTVAKLYFVPYPLFTGEATFTPCQKPGDHFGETDGGQVQVKGLKDGGGSVQPQLFQRGSLPAYIQG